MRAIAVATRCPTGLATLITLAIVSATANLLHAEACYKVHIGPVEQNNIVCQCNATHCDQLGLLEWPLEPGKFLSVVSSLAGQRWNRSELTSGNAAAPTEVGKAAEKNGSAEATQVHIIEVEANERRQQVLGYGGAFTDSACFNLANLEEPLRSHALKDYYSPTGSQYNLGRVPIGGTDMSNRAYTLNDELPEGVHEDLGFKHFRLQEEDLQLKVPMIKRAQQLSPVQLKLVANSWSAPSWMKSNRSLIQGNIMGNSSSGPYYHAYARYLLKFLDEYERLNLTMWALSPQNEPWTPKRLGRRIINYNSVNFEPEELADYLEHSLVPVLLASGRLGSDEERSLPESKRLRLFIWDDDINRLDDYLKVSLKGSQVRKYTDGLAYHWYSHGAKGEFYEKISQARDLMGPNYTMLSTEACFIGAPQPGSWRRGELYARDILENLRRGSSGWIDWNLVLDMSGGPSWSQNKLDSPILVDSQRQLYYRNPSYYALAHMSRFLKADGRVLATKVSSVPAQDSSLSADSNPALVAVATENPKQEAASTTTKPMGLVVLNRRPTSQLVRLKLTNCPLQRDQADLEFELAGSSVTSLAFSC